MPYRLVKILAKDKSNSFEIVVQKVKHRDGEEEIETEYKWENETWMERVSIFLLVFFNSALFNTE